MSYLNPSFIIPIGKEETIEVDTRETTEVFKFGSEKHKDQGFEKGTVSTTRHFYACLRHLWKWLFRFSPDEETGKSHLAHAHCRILMMIYQEQKGINDDRPKG